MTNRMQSVAVLIPSTGRPEQMRRNVGALLEQRQPARVDLFVVLAIPDDDWKTFMAAASLMKGDGSLLIYPRRAGTTAVQGWNVAYGAVGVDWYVLGADDIRWRAGWLRQALAVAEETGAHVVGLNDGGHTDLNAYAPHYMASRHFCESVLEGHIAPPQYKSWWFDREVCERALAQDAYAPAWDAWAEHLHPDWGQAANDATYELGRRHHDEDRLLYERRKTECLRANS